MDNTVILRPNYDAGNVSHVPLGSFNPVLSQLGVYMPELRPSAPRARYAHPPKTFPKNYVIKVQVSALSDRILRRSQSNMFFKVTGDV